MTTANQLIERGYQLAGMKDPGQAMSGQDMANGLDILNDMIDGWNTQRLYIVSVGETVVTVSGLPITIGPGQTINVTRPISVENGSFIRLNNVDFPIEWITREEYNEIAYKQVTSTVTVYGFYDQGLPTGKLYFWPYQTTGAELHLQLQEQLSSFANLTTDYTLAPGYRKAIAYSLAEEFCGGVRQVPPKVEQIAASARKAIRRTNVDVPQLDVHRRGFSPTARFLSGL